jgi:hypothetical protein
MLKVRRILLEGAAKLDEDRLNTKLPLELANLHEHVIHIECRKQIGSILSPRQRQQLEDITRTREHERAEAIGNGATAKIGK